MIRVAVIGIIGESVFLPVARFHEGGETVVATALHREWGAKGANQALAAARHGAAVSFLAAVNARDRAQIEAFAAQNGIDAMLCEKPEPGSYAVIMTDSKGQNRVSVYQGANLDEADVLAFAPQIECADILLLNNEVPASVNDRAVAIAKAKGVRVILNPAPARPLSDTLLESVDLFTPNEHETQGLSEKKNVVVTLGKNGCLIRSENRTVPAVSAGPVLDTTGAGDTFNGVLAVALAQGEGLRTACELANAAAAIKVTGRYVADAIPHRDQTILLWEKYYAG